MSDLLARLRAYNQRRFAERIRVPDRLPSRRRLLWLITLIQLLSAASAVLYLVFLWKGASLPWRIFPVGPVGALFLGMQLATAAWSWRFTAPLGRIEAALDAGAATSALPVDDVRAALSHHRRIARAMLIQWGVGTLLFVAGGLVLGGFSAEVMIHAGVLGASLSLCAAVLVRYAVLTWHGQGVAGYLLPDGGLGHLGELELERVYFHLGTLSMLLGVAMPAALLIIATSVYANSSLLAHVILDYMVVGLVVSQSVMQSISLPVGYLESRMKEVGDGDLGVRARVFAADTFGSLTTHFNRMVEGLRQRERIRDIFGRYVTRQVAEEILSGRIDLGGERRTATVLFADIRGFTEMSEEMAPEEVVSLLNQVLGEMVRVVLDEGGVLDKYIGDAIMALFGVPLSAGSPEADAQAALKAAQRMSEALDALNARRADAELHPVEIGIGVHTGELVAGNIGIPERMEYTVIGDTVNLCSRLEGLTKHLHRRILVSEATVQMLGSPSELVLVDTVQVRGRKEPVTVYTVAA
ncbi:MAG: HAMP domain-containing protein [Alphaproteobacteria bacterium]|nr:HAMP domain-containing protein [Alphaproteobacteria bacterium]